MMKRSKADKRLDYYPIIPFFLMWFLGAFLGSLASGNPHLFYMGFVTLPAVAVMGICFYKVYKSHREPVNKQDD